MFVLIVAAPATPTTAEQAAIFKAAGFLRMSSAWRTRDCVGLESDSYEAGKIDAYRDLNGDGRPEAVIVEGSAICYGNTGQSFWLVSKQTDGSWKRITSDLGFPEFLT